MHILINDFIGGVLDRGISLYVRNLIDGLQAEGISVSVTRAPAICRRLPRAVFYVLAVLFEQAVVPLLGRIRGADLTLYPYNSMAIADLLANRGRIVMHDLEQLNRGLSPSKAYYLLCYRAIRRLNRPVFTISEISRERLAASGLFGNGPITILPNTFYAFERLLNAQAVTRDAPSSILLCTGSTANKDVETVAADYLPKVLAAGFKVSVFGLHKASDAPRLASLGRFIASGQLRICGQLSDAEAAAEYRKHGIVWVHSLREGFGRCVVEGRLAGGRVICSDIPEFAALRDADVFLYKNAANFMATLAQLAASTAPAARYEAYDYQALLRDALKSALPAKAQ